MAMLPARQGWLMHAAASTQCTCGAGVGHNTCISKVAARRLLAAPSKQQSLPSSRQLCAAVLLAQQATHCVP